MTRPGLLLLHGWAFDASVWDALLALLPDFSAVRWDRGYFGPAHNPAASGPAVAVGHSLGAMILADRLPPDVPLVAINGFDHFTGEGGVPARVVGQMQHRFDADPGQVVDTFRARCGAEPADRPLNVPVLRTDLALLAVHRASTTARRILVLHGGADPIVPESLRQSGFPGAARTEIADGGHLLPLTHPQWCADQIGAFACG